MTHTRKMTTIAILSAVSFLLMYIRFPLIPSASFLEVDFSIVPVLFGLLVLDKKSSFAILFLRTLLKLFLNNTGPTTVIGLPMNIAAMAVFIIVFDHFWKNMETNKQYLLASVFSTLGSTGLMLVLNYVYAVPVYAAFANFDIRQILGLGTYLFAMVLPFNLLQGILLSLVFYLVYQASRPILKRI